MRAMLAAAALLTSLATACGRSATMADTDQVYRAILDSLYFEPGHRPATVVVDAGTASRDYFRPDSYVVQATRDLPRDLIDDFLAANSAETTLAQFRLVAAKQVFLDSAQEAAIFAEARRSKVNLDVRRKAWSDFKARYPAAPGIITLSRVGFNRAGTRALVWVDRRWGVLDASADLVLLTRPHGTWVLQEVRNLAVS